MLPTINGTVPIEETAPLLAFGEHKLYRTRVRRRICVRQIFLPFIEVYSAFFEISQNAEDLQTEVCRSLKYIILM